MLTRKWQKAQSCGSLVCLEVKKRGGTIYIRDNKSKKFVIKTDEASWGDFIQGVKNNEFDLL